MQETTPGLVLVGKFFSNLDKTVKYIFLSRGQVIEFSYINKDDGKDIICAPTQTACNLGCKFCYLSDYDLVVRNLEADEVAEAIRYVVDDLKLREREGRNNVLLISFMGCGEPLLDTNLIATCDRLLADYSSSYRIVRFAVASLIPSVEAMRKFTIAVRDRKIPLKFHLSLHSPFDDRRKEMMPASSLVQNSLYLLSVFVERTGNAAEIHYALIAGVNDRDEDVSELIRLLGGQNISVKFLAYNEKPSVDFRPSERVAQIREALETAGIKTEYYVPPGADIGSSCGQFLMDYYAKYNTKPAKAER